MRARKKIFGAVAVVALGAVCMAQSSTGVQSQSNDQQSTGQLNVGQQGTQVQQQNGKKPASMSTESEGSEVNSVSESSGSSSELDRRTQARREANEKLTEAQQTQQ